LTGGEIGARRRLAADPGDLDARLALATALAAKGSYREALEGLFAVMERDSGEHRDRARKAVLDIFNLLGDEHELTAEYRARLATLLW
jgi:putative thioredoxin